MSFFIPYNKKIINMHVDEHACDEPCKHYVIITYDDNSEERTILSGEIIYTILNQLMHLSHINEHWQQHSNH